MDGTFLDEAGQFDMERLKKLLHSYKEKGIYFAVASGRGLLSLEKHFADVKDEIIFIAEMVVSFAFMDKTSMKRPCLEIFTYQLLKS